jgi:hypothetical protein
MIDEAVKLGNKLDGDSLIIYILMLCLVGIIIFLLKIGKNELYEISKSTATNSEQLRTLVQAALSRGRDD